MIQLIHDMIKIQKFIGSLIQIEMLHGSVSYPQADPLKDSDSQLIIGTTIRILRLIGSMIQRLVGCDSDSETHWVCDWDPAACWHSDWDSEAHWCDDSDRDVNWLFDSDPESDWLSDSDSEAHWLDYLDSETHLFCDFRDFMDISQIKSSRCTFVWSSRMNQMSEFHEESSEGGRKNQIHFLDLLTGCELFLFFF